MASIQNLERWVDIANIGVVIALALSFVFGGASIYLSRKLNKTKDAQSAFEKRGADLKIEEASATAAKANKETAELAQQNIKLHTDLELATSESRSKQSELAIEQQKLTNAQQLLADAERKRSEAQLELEKTLGEVRRRQMPRTLSPDQRAHLMELLRAAPKGEVEIMCVLGDAEGYALAIELSGLLEAAGWTIGGGGGVHQGVFRGANPVGMRIIVHDASNAPQHAVILQTALSDIGFTALGEEKPEYPEEKIELLIGIKP